MDGRRHHTSRRARIAAALTVTLVASAALGGAHPAYGVAGGTPAADGQYGFVAHLAIGEHVRACTGALIDPEWVVTAAGCFAENGRPAPAGRPPTATTVTVGRAQLASASGGAVRRVTELVPHATRDVVLAKLDSPVIDVVPVAVGATAPATGEALRVAGFGRTATEWTPGRLHTAALDVQATTDATIDLAGPVAGAVCKGDAGGPTWRVRADGGIDLVGVHAASNQSGCLGVPESGAPARATDTRLDTIADWIGRTVRGGYFVRLPTSTAVLDTRSGLGTKAGVRTAGSVTTFPVAGVGGVPATDVTAVLIDVTAITNTSDTHLTVFPDGTPRPSPLTMVHAQADQIISNSALVNVPASGKLSVWTAESTNIAVDVQGYYTRAANTGGGYVPVTPTALVDTRSGLGGSTGPVPAGASRTFTLTGGVLPAGVTSAYFNLIAVGATARGYLGTSATGSTTRSVLNYVPGYTAHGITARLGTDGRATFTNGGTEPVNLVLTASGYYSAAVTGGGQRTLSARRVMDTRSAGNRTPITPNDTLDIPVGLPPGTVAAVNLIVVGNDTSGYLRAWPAGGAETTTSLANFPARGTGPRSAMAMVPVGAGGKIRVRNISDGATHLVVDLQGWQASPVGTGG
ncbi:trypsin-like serine protease [Jidongwangia harbinensis]|uniref:trypsin-like serine protease n=1 Tax=Jidongwangia harbinensis TaxID=2878561 RepID=UPI001CD91C07|nr:trypsin-like serine protease [Jidongwangia harbinensis]MCA2216013.1 trypsin-like serine protease [Jidongwangia harbinensis]